MAKYTLFLDTETSGLPDAWNKSFHDTDNWPHVLQVSWIIYDEHHQEIKRTNQYINESLISISPASQKIHGLTAAFLQKHGGRRKDVLRKLAYDLQKYQPLIVGHFLTFDLQVLGAAFCRSKLPVPFFELPCFCTMLQSKKYVRNPNMVYLALPLLYKELFDQEAAGLHNALVDAELTAACYYEMLRRGDIDKVDMEQQQPYFERIF